MERLVVNKLGNLLVAQGNGQYTSPCFGCDNSGVCIIEEDKICGFYKAIEKLYAYEDAEEQGLLHRTQVAIGQTVYTNFAMRGWYLRDKDRPYQAKVVFIGLNDSEEMGGGFFNIAYEKLGCMMQFRFSDIGKSVFPTKEEAERALAEMGGE